MLYFNSIIPVIDTLFTIANNNFNSAPLKLLLNVIKPQLNYILNFEFPSFRYVLIKKKNKIRKIGR